MSGLGGDDHAAALRAFGDAHRDLRGIVVVSAHWRSDPPLHVTSWTSAPLIYDFGGFPEELYRLTYPAPGDPTLAGRIADLVGARLETERGLDHGAWVPLRLAWPDASIPVVQLSLPDASPEEVYRVGQLLRPLRDEGVVVMGSGGIVHNLRRINLWHKEASVMGWAREFDQWVAEQIESGNRDGLFAYRSRGPHAELAAPTSEHFEPIFVALGAAHPDERMETIYQGFQYGNLSMRSFSFASARS
jgi:4,5-DOPA dioxygenase extradiol